MQTGGLYSIRRPSACTRTRSASGRSAPCYRVRYRQSPGGVLRIQWALQALYSHKCIYSLPHTHPCSHHALDTAPRSSLQAMPLFSPEQGSSHGLNLLAAAAATEKSGAELPDASLSLLTKPGPFNPAASLGPKVVKRILDLEFVEMAEVTVDDISPQAPGRPPPPARLPITDISQWLERYSLMAAVLCTKFPEKVPELFAYQACIVRAERNYEGGRWVAYDRQYRREALAKKDLNWSVPDPRLYSEAFTGRARSITRCGFCLQDDHGDALCPRNPNRPLFGWFPDPFLWPPQGTYPTPTPRSDHSEVCRRFNEGRCRFARCRYRHACSECGANHPRANCPKNRSATRSRSPHISLSRPPMFGPPGNHS